jgi:tetratricopeptide (TPR) repeat protein
MRSSIYIVVLFVSVAASAETIKFKNCNGLDGESRARYLNMSIESDMSAWFNQKKLDLVMVHDKNAKSSSECLIVYLKRKIILTANRESELFCAGSWVDDKQPIWKHSYDNSPDEFQDLSRKSAITNLVLNNGKVNFSLDTFNCMNPFLLPSEVEDVNNLGFKLAEEKQYADAVGVYKKVLATSPNRIVTYFNIADSYMALGQKDLAIQNYKTYVRMMMAKKLDAQIPKRVLDAIR